MTDHSLTSLYRTKDKVKITDFNTFAKQLHTGFSTFVLKGGWSSNGAKDIDICMVRMGFFIEGTVAVLYRGREVLILTTPLPAAVIRSPSNSSVRGQRL